MYNRSELKDIAFIFFSLLLKFRVIFLPVFFRPVRPSRLFVSFHFPFSLRLFWAFPFVFDMKSTLESKALKTEYQTQFARLNMLHFHILQLSLSLSSFSPFSTTLFVSLSLSSLIHFHLLLSSILLRLSFSLFLWVHFLYGIFTLRF